MSDGREQETASLATVIDTLSRVPIPQHWQYLAFELEELVAQKPERCAWALAVLLSRMEPDVSAGSD